jgi:Zn-dependent peptidase ImmA (M78 family)
MIVINTNWHIHSQIPYQAAHEIAHVLHEDPGVVYFHVPTAKSGIEAEANRTAINILAPMYFDEIEPEDANIDEFLGAFAIPSYMYDVTYITVRKLYANH